MRITKEAFYAVKLNSALIDYSVYFYTRPNDHFIVEVKPNERDKVVSIVKQFAEDNNLTLVENDNWCGGNRLGLIIPNMWEEIDLERGIILC